MSDDLLKRFDDVRQAYGAGHVSVSHAGVLAEIADRIEAIQAERDAADALAEVTEACLRMMDHAMQGTGKGDMALKPDGSLGLIEGWKRLAAYKRARSKLE